MPRLYTTTLNETFRDTIGPRHIRVINQSYGGVYRYYLKKEADEAGITYLEPPFNQKHYPDRNSWVISSNNIVSPVLNVRKHTSYVTPFGAFKYSDIPYFPFIKINDDIKFEKIQERRAFARWFATYGDFKLAYKYTYGFDPSPDIDESEWLLNDWIGELTMQEFQHLVDEQGIDKVTILVERLRQTKMLSDLLSHYYDKIMDGDEAALQQFMQIYNSSNENVRNLEDRYVKSQENPDYYEESFKLEGRRRSPQLGQPTNMDKLPETQVLGDDESDEGSDDTDKLYEAAKRSLIDDHDGDDVQRD